MRAPLGVRRAVASPPPSPPASPRALFVSFFTGLVRAHHWHTNRGKDFTLGTLSQPRQCQTVDTLVSSVDTPGAPASQGSKSFYRFFSLGPPNARNDQLLRLRGRAGGLDLEAQELPRPPDDLLVCRQLRDGGALVLAPLLPVLVAQTNSKTSRPLLRLRLRLRDAARDPERGALPRACRAYGLGEQFKGQGCGARRGHLWRVVRVARRAAVRGGCGDRPAAKALHAGAPARGSRSRRP